MCQNIQATSQFSQWKSNQQNQTCFGSLIAQHVILLISIVTICSSRGQIVTIEFGVSYFAQKAKSQLHPEIIGKRGGNDDFFYKIQYAQKFNSKLLITGSYSKYSIYTYYRFYKENAGGSFGWNGTNVRRFDLGLDYIIFPKSNFIVQPNIGLGIQKSIPDGDGCICSDISNGIRPDEFELLNEIDASAYSNTQLVPMIGLKFGYAFWGRLELFMNIQQVFGFKIIQELRMDYTYKGVQQPTAISNSDGTGRFWGLGIGYKFAKQKRN